MWSPISEPQSQTGLSDCTLHSERDFLIGVSNHRRSFCFRSHLPTHKHAPTHARIHSKACLWQHVMFLDVSIHRARGQGKTPWRNMPWPVSTQGSVTIDLSATWPRSTPLHQYHPVIFYYLSPWTEQNDEEKAIPRGSNVYLRQSMCFARFFEYNSFYTVWKVSPLSLESDLGLVARSHYSSTAIKCIMRALCISMKCVWNKGTAII